MSGSPDASTADAWLALQIQASRFRRHLRVGTRPLQSPEAESAIGAYLSTLDAHLERAAKEFTAFDDAARCQARRAAGIRVAVLGKGGAGKTVIAATLARILGCRGRPVLAADLDVNPGLSSSLGLGIIPAGLPPEAVEPHAGAAYGWQLASGLSPIAAVERHAVHAPDGVRYLGHGKIGDGEERSFRQSSVALREILLGLGAPRWDIVGDLEAGPTTPFERYHSFADHVIVVVGPAWRSAMTARRLAPMIEEGQTMVVVANRFRDEPDHPGWAPAVRIPFDPELAEAERLGVAPIDYCPASPAIEAIRELAATFVPEEVPT